ncbi:hypothetical protein KCU85_g2688, partial [Aureobasidium melanogenum]
LYTERCHFLFELIQNADDNTYADDVQPEVALAYRSDGLFLFACNEVGMTKANVNAICNINQSTKTLLKDGKRSCIGEKGIGFKAVFKVSNKVWIRSNNYTFMFDKTTPLGMVDPIWADFPDFSKDLHMNTMICLKIENQEDRDSIRKELTKVLEPSSFMFLRRLSKIRIVKLDDSADISTAITLSHTEQAIPNTSLSLITTTKSFGKKAQHSVYVVSSYTAQNMPRTERRKDVTESVIKLAFHIDDNWDPVINKHDIFAFLPVCSSGLPFLIQADFLLVASRQEIEADQPWNRHLQHELVHALVQAFQQLNNTRLKYGWPAYLPKEELSFKFCDMMIDKFFARVSNTKILESRSPELCSPKVMLLVPDLFRDAEGNPLLTPVNDRYLSAQYDLAHVSVLVKQSLTTEKFVEMLKTYISKFEAEFQKKPDVWHEKVCGVLTADWGTVRLDELLLLRVVLLDNGRWINPKPRIKGSYARPPPPIVFYLPPPDTSSVIPKGVSLSIVAPDAARNEIRRSFYRSIGAKDLDGEEVYRGIIKQHKNEIRNPDVDVLLSHAQYVFSLPSAAKSAQDLRFSLWVADVQGHPRRGSELHMDLPGSSSTKPPVSQYFSKNPSVAHFINSKYLSAYHDKPQVQVRWLAWLQDCLGVHSIPRLTDRHNKTLSKEFEWIVATLSSRDWLACLNANWEEYQLHKLPKPTDSRIPSEDARTKIGSLQVDCTDGKTAKLSDTMLPSLRSAFTTVSISGFHFLDLLHEDDPQWLRLSAFGVVTTKDLNFCLLLLLKLSQSATEPDKLIVLRLYRDILWYCEQSAAAREKTTKAFKNYSLVYLNGKWITLTNCVWEAPRCLQNVLSLALHYAPVRTLFKSVLSVPDAGIDHFVAELVMLDNDVSSMDRIKEMLLELSVRVKSQPKSKIDALDHRKIFPVLATDGKLQLLTAGDWRWFIPDAPHLKKAFNGVLPLLDYDITSQERLEPLLHHMKVWDKRLSQNAIEQEVVEGLDEAVLEHDSTDSFQEKVHYLLCLTNPDQHHIMKSLLESFEIFSVESISIHRMIVINNQEIRGKVAAAPFSVSKDQKIFIPIEDVDSNDLDYYKLVEKLAPLCGFQTKHLQIAARILSLNKISKIEDMLSENHINFEKRRFEKMATKLVDDSAGIVLPTKTVRPTRPGKTISSDSSKPSSSEVSTPVNEEEPFDIQVRQGPNQKQNKVSKVALPRGHDYRKAPEREAKHKQNRERNAAAHSARAPLIRSDDEDSMTMPIFSAPLESLIKSSRGPQRPGLSTRSSHKYVVSDDDIKNIDDEESDSESESSSQEIPTSSGAYRSKYMTSDTANDDQIVRIGEQGEMKMHTFFENLLGDVYTDLMWTSHARTKYTDQAFEDDDSQFADFTIQDVSGRLTKWLVERHHEEAQAWLGKKGSDAITYCIEVKSTYGPHNEPFHMSQNQLEMASKYRVQSGSVPERVYVIMRVSNLTGRGHSGSAHVQPFVDPYRLFEQRDLSYIAPGGYLVFSDQ